MTREQANALRRGTWIRVRFDLRIRRAQFIRVTRAGKGTHALVELEDGKRTAVPLIDIVGPVWSIGEHEWKSKVRV